MTTAFRSFYYFCCCLIVLLCGIGVVNKVGNDGDDDNDDQFMIHGGKFGMVGVGFDGGNWLD